MSRIGNEKEILHGVSGCFKSGQVSAIMGPSGAGKTSLLNSISGYRSKGVRGRLKVNDQPREERKFRKNSCYITQEDLLIPMLSTHELMAFAAQLKLPTSYSMRQRLNVVSEVQHLLGIKECKGTRTEQLSGGQKRRLSIALELINNPPVLFLDEPTSGLDTVSTTNLVELLRDLSRGGRTIVCTIHQPSALILEKFDSLYVLGGGYCVYQGPSLQIVPFLARHGLHCPHYFNPADFIIELMEDEDNIKVLSDATANGKISCLQSSTNAEIKGETVPEKIVNNGLFHYGRLREDKAKSRLFALVSFWIQFSTLLSRMILQTSRNRTSLRIQLLNHLGCGILFGVLFYNKGNDGVEFFAQLKYAAGVILFHSYTQTMAPILTYPFEVKLLKKEHFNQWYGLCPYYIALTISKIPINIFFSLLYLNIVFLLSGIPWELNRYVVWCLTGTLVALIAEGMGLTIGALFSVTNGAAVGPFAIAPFLGVAIYGFDFAKEIPGYMMQIMRLSFMRSGVEAIVLSMFGLDRKPLDCNEAIYCHFSDPRILLSWIGLDQKSVIAELRDLFIFFVFFRLSFYFILKWRLRK